MSRNLKTYMVIVGIVTIVTILVIVTIVALNITTQMPNTNFDQLMIGLLVTIGGALVGSLAAIVVYQITSMIQKKRQQILLAESNEQRQKEEFIRLSQQGLELEKQRTVLEKQTEIVLWIFAAVEKIEDDPRLAFIIVYQGLETEIHGLISRQFSDGTLNDGDKQTINLSYDFDFLAKYVTPDQARTILQMRDLRNRVVHGEVGPEEITPEKVKEYLQEALHLAQVISRIKQDEEI